MFIQKSTIKIPSILPNLLLILILLNLLTQLKAEPRLPYHMLPIQGNASLGYYYTSLYIGEPAQKQSVILDTGSSLMALPCSKCTQCGTQHIDDYFNIQKSKTAKVLSCASSDELCKQSCKNRPITNACEFKIAYAEGSALFGIYIQDYVRFNGQQQSEQSVKLTFGCTTKQTNYFYKQQANGILGLSPNRTNALEKILERHIPTSKEISQIGMCYGISGGTLMVGGVTSHYLNAQKITTTYSDKNKLYEIENVGNVMFGDTVIHKKGQSTGRFGIFIDSGTTLSYLPYNQYVAFITKIREVCDNHDQCFQILQSSNTCFHLGKKYETVKQLQEKLLEIFPSIFIEILQKKVEWKPYQYFLLHDFEESNVCLGLKGFDRFLLGGNWMINKNIVFNTKQKIVEIYPNSNCQYDAHVKPDIKFDNSLQQKSKDPVRITTIHRKSEVVKKYLIQQKKPKQSKQP